MREASPGILLVQDNSEDVQLVRMALEETVPLVDLYVAATGQEAIQFINSMGKTAGKPCPSILLLNLKVTGGSGMEVLKSFRRHPMGRTTPVIMMPPRPSPTERTALTDFGVTSDFQSATTFDDYLKLGQWIQQALTNNRA